MGYLKAKGYTYKAAGGGGTTTIEEDADGNIGIGTSTFDDSAVGSLNIGNGTAPAASTAGQCSIYAKDTAACVLLLNMNGSDDGTTFTDSSPSNHTMTVLNQAHTDTTVKKFGTASLQCDGVTDNISTPTSSDWQFGAGDFTVECWIYPLDVIGYQMFIGHYLPAADFEFRLNSVGNKVEFVYSGVSFLAHSATIVADTWTHVAYSRVNTVGNIFVNGVGGTAHTNTKNYNEDQPIAIGSRPGGTYGFNGHIDGVRIMKGEGLYVEDFTPPTAEMGGDSSELYVLDELGNESNISPHNLRSEWEFYSKNKNTGRCIKVNMERMIKRLEELHPGEKFLEEWTE